MEKEKRPSIIRNIAFVIQFFIKEQPIVLVLDLFEIITGAMLPFLSIYLPKIAVEMIINQEKTSKVFLVLGCFILLNMVVAMLHYGFMGAKYIYTNQQRPYIMGLLFEKSIRLPYEFSGKANIDTLYWKAIYTLTHGDGESVTLMVSTLTSLSINVLCFVLYSTVIGTLSLWMLFGILGLSLLNTYASMKLIKYYEMLREDESTLYKKYVCVRNSMGNVSMSKDIRMFGMKHWLVALRDSVIERMAKLGNKRQSMNSRCEKIRFMLAMLRDMLAYAYLIGQAVKGNVSIGNFVLLFGAITGFSNFVNTIMDNILHIRKASGEVEYIRQYLNLPENICDKGRGMEDIHIPIEIEFKNVSFSYDEEHLIFDGLNLKIKAGEKIALVGVNGAGKSTFIKLLTGMYEPSSGEILLNGINIKEFAKEEFYKLFSTVFQECVILPVTVGENITFQCKSEIDRKRAWNVIEKAGLRELFEQKEITLDSYMTKVLFQDGIELSGGQKQRLLLARALYKDAPILILDEPTAALDPIAESEIYDSYAKYSEGKTSIFVSHRLASTRFSDRILMMENGKIVEMGSHEELMKQNGKYANMFEIQSNYYKEGGDNNGNRF